ncbi:MAG: ABC-2 transporter permease [Firmicutes bacterium]|nr:ABC-2 transporter permease [Bacillota bacterium]
MKGLLLKDFYCLIKNARSYFIIVAIFAFVSVLQEEISFFTLYPSLLAALLPVTLLSFDERSKWNVYSQTLPVKKSEIVSSKYITGLCFVVFVVIVLCITNGIRMHINGTLTAKRVVDLIILMFSLFFMSSFPIPMMFKLGVEKGRIVYYIITFAIFFGLSGFLGAMGAGGARDLSFMGNLRGIVFVVILVIYLLTWRLSIFLFERKEEV